MDVKEKFILEYIDKNYIIKDDLFFNKYNNLHEWGNEIIFEISKIFSVDNFIIKEIFNNWIDTKGVIRANLNEAWNSKRLKCKWTPEMAQDLHIYGVVSCEENIIANLAQKISDEINSEILRDLKHEIKTQENFFSLMKCVGYDTTLTVYDPDTFAPLKYFVSLKHNEVQNERKINTQWQDWIRAREQDKKT